MMPLLRLKNIAFTYPRSLPLFTNLSFEIFENEKIYIRGENGAGKTTLFSLIMGLLRPQKGDIIVKGKVIKNQKDLRYLRQTIGFLFQDPDDQLFCPTLLDDVLFGPLNRGINKEEAYEQAINVLKTLNIDNLAHTPPYALSGGQKRLGALAAVLAMKPDLLLLDEPSSGLDKRAWQNLVDVLNQLDMALIIASHDIPFLEHVTRRGYELSSGMLTFAQ
ncbi:MULTISPECIES: energy-coupling factor ABC transporter ATP-binding protein [Aminobacterium]|jgi:cobalt/nickel transport system ATP-binding protein|uniref:energy-coupling factor ABC transporter ATP-binding protein n=1 Tax=Aminobacterium TaxID=81466 RepID=UPI0016ABE23E|nr:ABC transporter ATP-binding protein [Aminobacterium sp. EBM-42]NLK30229.1 ABC transporter ATP-binding protein [Aminobacterium colombiense]